MVLVCSDVDLGGTRRYGERLSVRASVFIELEATIRARGKCA